MSTFPFKHYFCHFSGTTISVSTYELLIANINWYCRPLLAEHMDGRGTAVAVILAVRLCLPFIWTFSCLSFLSFVCFLFTPAVILCHNKVSYIPSSNTFLILSPYGWFCCLCFHSIILLPSDRAVTGQGLLFYSVWCGFRCVCVWAVLPAQGMFQKIYVRGGVSRASSVMWSGV